MPFATVPDGTYGPYLGQSGTARVAVWASHEGEQRAWFSVPIAEDGKPMGAFRRLVDAPEEIGLVLVTPSVGDSSADPGFLLLSTWADRTGTRVESLRLTPGGGALSAPVPLSTTPGPVLWIDSVPTGRGSLVFWASRSGTRARVSVVALDERGVPSSAVRQLATSALAWQLVHTENSAVLGVVREDSGSPGRVIELQSLDDFADAVGPTVEVSRGADLGADFDLAWVDEGILVVWSEPAPLESRLMMVRLSGEGQRLAPATPVVDPIGEQALIGLFASPRGAHAYLVWENLGDPDLRTRKLRIGRFKTGAGLAAGRAVLHVDPRDETLPEFVASEDGFHALVLSRACLADAPCSEERHPMLVGLSSDLVPNYAQPLQVPPPPGATENPALGFADMGWGLICSGAACSAIGAVRAVPAPVFLLGLRATLQRWIAPVQAVTPAPRPAIRSNRALLESAPLSDIAVATVGERRLIATLTYFDPSTPYVRRKTPAPDGRYAPIRAELRVTVRNRDKEIGSHIISYRARSLGGISLASSGQQALLAWSAMDRKKPQVFVTLLDADGKRRKQKVLTYTKKGEISAVGAVALKDGWAVAWIDTRHGHPEVYVVKLDAQLKRISPERRLARTVGSVSGLSLLARGEVVLLARTEARSHAQGVQDVVLSALNASDLSAIDEERVVAPGQGHAHSCRLAARGSGAVLSWVVDQMGSLGGGAVLLAKLDSRGAAVGAPDRLAVDSGTLSAIATRCTEKECQVALNVQRGSSRGLEALRWGGAEVSDIRPLAPLSPRLRDAIPPVFGDATLYYADSSGEERGVLRQLEVDWQ